MNRLPRDRQAQIIQALTEGCSIRAVERMTGCHRDTIMRLLVRIGDHCTSIMDEVIQNIPAGIIECDEVYTFVGEKDYHYPLEDQGPDGRGTQYVAMAMDRNGRWGH